MALDLNPGFSWSEAELPDLAGSGHPENWLVDTIPHVNDLHERVWTLIPRMFILCGMVEKALLNRVVRQPIKKGKF